MILSAHQPAYLPWLGLFHKIALSDVFCILDTPAYSRHDFVNRNRIKTANGPIWLTVPVETHGTKAQRICDVRIARSGWRRKHLAAMAHSYRKAPYFDAYFPEIEAAIAKPYTFVTELASDLMRLLMRRLAMTTQLVIASDYTFRGKKSEYLVDICRTLRASSFLFGAQGRDYANAATFTSAGIDLAFQAYRHPVYRQRYGEFVPRLSIVDLLFNHGPASRAILLSGNAEAFGDVA
jgi:hypothetical protein